MPQAAKHPAMPLVVLVWCGCETSKVTLMAEGAEEGIWVDERGSDRRLEKI
jgi:hypothetical protein